MKPEGSMQTRRWRRRTITRGHRTEKFASASLAFRLEAVETGVSTFLILMGAILAFAVKLSPPGIDLRVVGVIFLVVGGIGLIIAVLDRIGLAVAVLHRLGIPVEDRNAGESHDSRAAKRQPDDGAS
jgi:hypothetical protein